MKKVPIHKKSTISKHEGPVVSKGGQQKVITPDMMGYSAMKGMMKCEEDTWEGDCDSDIPCVVIKTKNNDKARVYILSGRRSGFEYSDFNWDQEDSSWEVVEKRVAKYPCYEDTRFKEVAGVLKNYEHKDENVKEDEL